jgi:hypothetical protein
MPSNNSELLSLRHTLATLAYRAAKVLRDTPDDFSQFRPAAGARSAGEILAHLGDLMDWALSLAQGKQRWNDSDPGSWANDSTRFFAGVRAFDQYLGSGEPLHTPAEKLFQGAVADALSHVGQIALMRRLAAAPIRPENYGVAKIEAGLTGPDQNPPVREF